MIVQSKGLVFVGLEPVLVSVEVECIRGLPRFEIVGLAANAVKEGRRRIASALRSLGVDWGKRSVTVNLSPASLSKQGSGLDLPIAIALLAGLGHIDPEKAKASLAIGELSLTGAVKPCLGAFAASTFAASRDDIEYFFHPVGKVKQSNDVFSMQASELANVVRYFQEGEEAIGQDKVLVACNKKSDKDWSEIRGQGFAKRGLEIAAAGGHNVLMLGAPGVGKTYMAQRFNSILPNLSGDELAEVQNIYSFTGQENFVGQRPPFRDPHHRASSAGLLGGGKPFMPGEFSLAHKGVLFLDEVAEFSRDVLEALRQPLASQQFYLARANGKYRLPADFLLLAAMNLCPCGATGVEGLHCVCTGSMLAKYWQKLSAPIINRIDIVIGCKSSKWEDLFHASHKGKSSDEMQSKVMKARQQQALRHKGPMLNARLRDPDLPKRFFLLPAAMEVLKEANAQHHLSTRSVHKVLRVARTIADLAQESEVHDHHMLEALMYHKSDLSGFS